MGWPKAAVRSRGGYQWVLVALDLMVIGVVLAVLHAWEPAGEFSRLESGGALAIVIAAWLINLFLHGEYTLHPERSWPLEASVFCRALVAGTVSAAGIGVLLPGSPLLGPLTYLVATAALLPLLLVVRRLALRAVPRQTLSHRYLVLTDGAATQSFWKSLTASSLPRFVEIVGSVPVNGGVQGPALAGLPRLGAMDALPELVKTNGVQTVILGGTHELAGEEIHRLLECQEKGVRVISAFAAHEEITRRTPLMIHPAAAEESLGSVQHSKYATRLKRVMDVAATLCLLPIGLPLMALAALAVLLSDGFPILYRQERVGEDRRPFMLLKIRTMVRDAEAKTGPVWASEGDPRITPVGRFLRATRLDELPQLVNVLRGDMSLVGPRPERPAFVDQFLRKIPYYEQRLLIRPGLTGWAQVNHTYDRDEDDVYEKLRYDLYYLRHLSFSLDLQILLATVGVVCKCSGAH